MTDSELLTSGRLQDQAPAGLTSEEAVRRLSKYGRNEVGEKSSTS